MSMLLRALYRQGLSRSAAIESLEPRRLLAADLPNGFTDTELVTGLFSPTAMDIAPDGSERIFVAEQTGAVRVVKNGQLLTQPFAQVSVTSFGEHGLLGITFDPNFSSNHYVYVYYTTSENPFRNRVSRFTANGDVAAGGETVVFNLDFLDSNQFFHDGGALHFGPDGKLYIATGENQHPENSQSLSNLQGKILRINSDGSIPTDNPFYGSTTGNNRAIWAYGFRNPFTFAFQPGTGMMYINDVGNDLFEEVNQGQAGGNFGWPLQEGGQNTGQPGITDPIHYYNHGIGCAITGGVFYPGSGSFPSQYLGKYYFADFCGGWIKIMDPSNHNVSSFATNIPAPVDLDIDTDGAMYYLARTHDDSTQDNSGFISVIRYSIGQPPDITQHPTDKTVAQGTSVTFSTAASGQAPLSYQWQRNGQNINGATAASYTIDAASMADDGMQYRVRVSNNFGNATSSPATLTVIDDQPPAPTILTPSAGTIFYAGQTFTYSGSATDEEDGELDGSHFTWQVDYHTGTVVRPFVQPVSGSTSGSFTIPTITPYTKSNVFYRVILTVTDSHGLSTTVTRDLVPQTSDVSVKTNVPGLTIKLDGQDTSPGTFNGVVGVARTIGAAAQQTLNGKTYVFDHWSDGGDISHEISTPSKNKTYTAYYVQAITKGLQATYFNNKNFTGTQVNRIDSVVSFDFGTGSPDPLIARDTFAARWTGKFQALASDTYTFSIVTDGGVRLRVNGQIVINELTPANSVRTLSGSINLAGGLKYPVVLQYIHDTGSSEIDLRYATSTVSDQTVSRGLLYPPLAQVTALAPIADAYVQGGGSANSNFGGEGSLLVKSYKSEAYERDGYLRFDLSSVSVITKAVLRVYGQLSGGQNANVPLGVYSAGKSGWTDSSITFNNRPVLGVLLGQALVSTHTTEQWWEFDLTDFLRAEKAAGNNVLTFILKNIQETNAFTQLNSKEAGSNGPQLLITS